MKRAALTPIEQAAEDNAPNSVSYDITVVWPNGQRSCYVTVTTLPLDQAAKCLAVLAEELRQAAGSGQETAE